MDLTLYPEGVDNRLPETCIKFEMKLVGTKLLTVELGNIVHSCSRHGLATVRLTLLQ